MFNVSFCEKKEEWDSFILENSNIFLQSFEWGNLQEKNGKKVFRIQVSSQSNLIAQAQVFIEPFFIKKYLYIPYGPVFQKGLSNSQKTEALLLILTQLKTLALKENCVFLRVEPLETLPEAPKFKYVTSFKRLQPKKTLILDLTKTEEELQAGFKQKNRQNINFAKKNGVIIENSKDNFENFIGLMQKTEERQDFGIHPDSYYKNILNSTINSQLFSAEFENKVINSIITIYFGQKAFSLHGGSDYNFRHYKSANLLYWEIILDAKSRGLKEFDFWGIDEKKWPGVTTFKKSFGGTELIYPEGVDIIFSNFWYYLIKIIRSAKKLIK